MDKETVYWLGFSAFPGIGPVRFKLLREYFGNAENIWNASSTELQNVGLGEKLSSRFTFFRKHFEPEAYSERLQKLHIGVVTLINPHFPKLLAQIPDAPFLLYVKGKKMDKPLELSRTIAVVGTRKITSYGREVTEKLTQELVRYGFTIVSGMAYGVDAVAHVSAMDAGGKTVAVLGCGIDIIAPPANAQIYQRISEDGFGAIVSEMPLSLRPNKGMFPARNRIISGLSLGVVVTEGADDSGALITARNAAEQGREVFAVPGSINSIYSRGPAKLLKNGAKLVESVDDIISELGLNIISGGAACHKSYHPINNEEYILLSLLAENKLQIDELIRLSELTSAVVTATITILEMKGVIKEADQKYILTNTLN
jgi:DNA processing protein